jgi:hypothetical protein
MRSLNSIGVATAATILLSLSSCTASKDNASKLYEPGSRVETGHLVYTVFETQWLPQLGAGDSARVPKNRFFLIRITAVNSGSEELYVPNLTLKDDQGNALKDDQGNELPDGEGVSQWVGYVRKVKPAESISGNIVFDAEPKHYHLIVTDENGEKPAIIDLPLNFSSETPQLPVPGASTPASGSADFQTPVKK